MTAYPLSKATRLEFIGDVRSLSFSEETITQVFSPDGFLQLSCQDQTRTIESPLKLAEGAVAFVHDTGCTTAPRARLR